MMYEEQSQQLRCTSAVCAENLGKEGGRSVHCLSKKKDIIQCRSAQTTLLTNPYPPVQSKIDG